jgi:hypothetical protein
MTDGDGSPPSGDRTATTAAGTDADRDGDGSEREDHLAHLADVEDGCGCAEVWEHLSERTED